MGKVFTRVGDWPHERAERQVGEDAMRINIQTVDTLQPFPLRFRHANRGDPVVASEQRFVSVTFESAFVEAAQVDEVGVAKQVRRHWVVRVQHVLALVSGLESAYTLNAPGTSDGVEVRNITSHSRKYEHCAPFVRAHSGAVCSSIVDLPEKQKHMTLKRRA